MDMEWGAKTGVWQMLNRYIFTRLFSDFEYYLHFSNILIHHLDKSPNGHLVSKSFNCIPLIQFTNLQIKSTGMKKIQWRYYENIDIFNSFITDNFYCTDSTNS